MLEKRMVYRSFNFFFLQAIAITFEDLVIYIAKAFIRKKIGTLQVLQSAL